jgi:hypothetical protein
MPESAPAGYLYIYAWTNFLLCSEMRRPLLCVYGYFFRISTFSRVFICQVDLVDSSVHLYLCRR